MVLEEAGKSNVRWTVNNGDEYDRYFLLFMSVRHFTHERILTDDGKGTNIDLAPEQYSRYHLYSTRRQG